MIARPSKFEVRKAIFRQFMKDALRKREVTPLSDYDVNGAFLIDTKDHKVVDGGLFETNQALGEHVRAEYVEQVNVCTGVAQH